MRWESVTIINGLFGKTTHASLTKLLKAEISAGHAALVLTVNQTFPAACLKVTRQVEMFGYRLFECGVSCLGQQPASCMKSARQGPGSLPGVWSELVQGASMEQDLELGATWDLHLCWTSQYGSSQSQEEVGFVPPGLESRRDRDLPPPPAPKARVADGDWV